MSNLERLLLKQYNAQRYNCSHFVTDLWFELTGQEIKKFALLFTSKDKTKYLECVNQMTKLESPEEPCLVLMTRPPCVPHVGIFHKNKILHMTPNGVRADEKSRLKSQFKLRYYK